MRTPRPSRAGQLASIQTTPATAAKFRREADRLSLRRHAFLAVLLRTWAAHNDDTKHAMIRGK